MKCDAQFLYSPPTLSGTNMKCHMVERRAECLIDSCTRLAVRKQNLKNWVHEQDRENKLTALSSFQGK